VGQRIGWLVGAAFPIDDGLPAEWVLRMAKLAAYELSSRVRFGMSANESRLFSNSGPGVKLSMNILAGFRVLSAVGVYPPHDGVR
jgi:hypothetical protein